MVSKASEKLFKAAHAYHAFDFFRTPLEREAIELNRCLKEVGEKRDRALAKKKREDELIREHRTILTSRSEDDRYADDSFYQKKLRECYDKKRPLRRAMGLP